MKPSLTAAGRYSAEASLVLQHKEPDLILLQPVVLAAPQAQLRSGRARGSKAFPNEQEISDPDLNASGQTPHLPLCGTAWATRSLRGLERHRKAFPDSMRSRLSDSFPRRSLDAIAALAAILDPRRYPQAPEEL